MPHQDFSKTPTHIFYGTCCDLKWNGSKKHIIAKGPFHLRSHLHIFSRARHLLKHFFPGAPAYFLASPTPPAYFFAALNFFLQTSPAHFSEDPPPHLCYLLRDTPAGLPTYFIFVADPCPHIFV